MAQLSMTMIVCKECSKQISSEADNCLHCGATVSHVAPGANAAHKVGNVLMVVVFGWLSWKLLQFFFGFVAGLGSQ